MPQLGDGRVKRMIEVDKRVIGPQRVPEPLPRDNLPRLLQKQSKNTQRLILQLQFDSAFAKLAACRIQLEDAESNYSRVVEWGLHDSAAV